MMPPPVCRSAQYVYASSGWTWSFPFMASPINVHKKTKNTIAAINFTAASLFPRFDTAKKLPTRSSTGRTYAISPNIPKRKPLTVLPTAPPNPRLLIKSSSAAATTIHNVTSTRNACAFSISAIRSFFVCVFLLFDDLRFPAAIGHTPSYKTLFILSYLHQNVTHQLF